MALKPYENLPIFESVYEGSQPIKIFNYLKAFSPLSARSLRKYFFKGKVYLNNLKGHSEAIVKPGDRITVFTIQESCDLPPEAIPFTVIFENQELLIVNKPAQMAVHPVNNITSGTLANGISHYFLEKGIQAKVRPVHRLDFGTSGLVIFAKNAISQAFLSKEIQEHHIRRIYQAIVTGIPKQSSGKIDLPIGLVKGKRGITSNGQSAITHYHVLEKFDGASLLELELQTGRTHQIRVHLQAIGHPILGDPQYGVHSPYIKRPALHAGKISFQESGLPIDDQTVAWPEDFEKLLFHVKNL